MATGFHSLVVVIAVSMLRVPLLMAQNDSCEYYHQIFPGQTYPIYNTGYPNLYGTSVRCQWLLQAITGYRAVLTCSDIQIPDSYNCRDDSLTISKTGDLENGQIHCGNETVSVVSQSNTLAIGLTSTQNSNGGRFYCEVTAIADELSSKSAPRANTCDCGWGSALRVIGGTEADVNEFPYVAAVMDLTIERVRCGANIISENFALTAAHCLISRTINQLALQVGVHNLKMNAENLYSKQYDLNGALVHPDFDIKTLNADLAILETAQRIEFNLYVGPICLPFRFSSALFVGETVTIAGWGLTEYSGPLSDTLQKAEIRVVDNSECAKELDRPVTDKHICAYADNKDTCQYDSGGPVYWYDSSSKRNFLIGMTSFGLGCDFGVPSVYTRVASYLPWIISATPSKILKSWLHSKMSFVSSISSAELMSYSEFSRV